MIAEELKVVVRAEVDKAISDMKKLDKSLGDTGKSAQGMGVKLAAVGAAVAAGAMIFRGAMRVVNDLTQAYRVQELAEARLAAVIRATGGSAGFTTDEMKKMASALQGVTTYGDEAIIGMQSILATFRSIQGDVFEKTTELALDLSAAFGQDLKSSALQLGKALEDPTTGLTALRRIGVSFTEAQREMIQGMVDAGDQAGAQTEILKVLEGQVGGVARAMRDTAAGAADALNNAIGDLKESLGQVFLTGARPFNEWLTGVVTDFTKAIERIREFKQVTQELADMAPGGAVNMSTDYGRQIAEAENQVRLAMERSREWSERIRKLEEAGEGMTGLANDARFMRNEEIRTIQVWEAQIADLLRLQEEQNRLKEEAKRLTEEAEAAENRRLANEAIYMQGRSDVMGILNAAMTEEQKLLAQIAELEKLRWSEGSKYESDRLAAIDVLMAKLEELRKAAGNTGSALNAAISGRAGGLRRPGMQGLSTGDEGAAGITVPTTPGMSFTMMTSFPVTQAVYDLYDALEKAKDGGVALGEAITEVASESFEEMVVDSSGLVGTWSELVAHARTLHTALEENTEELKRQQQIAEDISMELADFAGMLASEIGGALSGDAPDMRNALKSLAVGITNIFAPGMGVIAAGVFDILAGAFDLLVGKSKTYFDKAAELREKEIAIREEQNDRLRDQFDLEFDLLKDAWQRGLITSPEFGDLGEEVGEKKDEALKDPAAEVIKEELAVLYARRDELQAELDSLKWWQLAKKAIAMGYYVANEIAIADLEAQLANITSAATGADFVTNGPQLMMVGDNASGREHVMVNPNPGSSMGTVININGPVFGDPDAVAVEISRMLERAGRRGLVTA